MTKMQRLQWENEQMKKALEEIYALCNLEGEERKEFMKQFEFEDAQFYPIVVGTIESVVDIALTAVKNKK